MVAAPQLTVIRLQAPVVPKSWEAIERRILSAASAAPCSSVSGRTIAKCGGPSASRNPTVSVSRIAWPTRALTNFEFQIPVTGSTTPKRGLEVRSVWLWPQLGQYWEVSGTSELQYQQVAMGGNCSDLSSGLLPVPSSLQLPPMATCW